MKTEFNSEWKKSKQPRKQRKYVAKAPIHIKRKFVSVNLLKELRKKYGKRSIPVRKGDRVEIMRGKFKKKQGKVLRVEINKCKIIIEGIQIKKIDGSKVEVPIKPSNLRIIELNLDDKKRNKKFSKQEIKQDSVSTPKTTIESPKNETIKTSQPKKPAKEKIETIKPKKIKEDKK